MKFSQDVITAWLAAENARFKWLNAVTSGRWKPEEENALLNQGLYTDFQSKLAAWASLVVNTRSHVASQIPKGLCLSEVALTLREHVDASQLV